jgi:hypothetical protein
MSLVDSFPNSDATLSDCIVCDADGWSCDEYGPQELDIRASLSWYYLVAPHKGPNRLSVSWSNDFSGTPEPLVDVGAISFSGVDQTTPFLTLIQTYGADLTGTGSEQIDHHNRYCAWR